MDYYALDKDNRWLEGGDSPCSIGGRSTDVRQIAFSLRRRVKELFPINKVPQELVSQLDELEAICIKADKAIMETIGIISAHIARIAERTTIKEEVSK